MKYIAQVYTGGYAGGGNKNVSAEFIREKLEALTASLPVSAVIMGWLPDERLYVQTREYLMKKHIELYLWFPVFAEVNAAYQKNEIMDIRCRGAFQNPDPAAFQPGESFDFNCPGDERALDIALALYDRYFANAGFDGVFLDKIRYPTVSGCDCGCNAERKRAKVITEAVAKACRHFRARGLKIGLDVFAPFLSGYVGQDLKELTALCDFIKPMMYRRAYAPAGLPYEMLALSERGSFRDCLTVEFITKDLSRLVNGENRCPVYAGVEVNSVPGVVAADPAYVKESVAAFENAGAEGAVLSWNILEAPDANWQILI